jgi:RNase H-fold protein (predicted Holliday junction resolvase)
VDVDVVVAVDVGEGGVWVAVSEGVTGIKVSGSAVDTDESKQPTRDSDSSNHIKRSLEKGCPL